jgi:hypothetical protein
VRVIPVEPVKLHATSPLQVTAFAVDHFAVYEEGMEYKGVIGDKSFETRFGDNIKINADFSESAHAYVLLFNADGSEQLVWPVNAQNRPDPKVPPEKVMRVAIPSAQSGRSLCLDDEPRGGWQAVALVLSRQPLPAYADWLQERGPAGWGKEAVVDSAVWAWASPHFTVADSSLALWVARSPINSWVVAGQGVFGHDHEGLYRRLPGGRILRATEQTELGLPQVERLARLLRKVGGVELVEMVAFAVRPKEDE